MEDTEMKTLLVVLLGTTVAHAAFVQHPSRRMPASDECVDRYECAVTRVIPLDHDRNPGYKVNIILGYKINNEIGSLEIIHVLSDGTEFDRSSQYSRVRLSSGNGWAKWSGYYYNGKRMVGTFDKRRDTYTEVLTNNGRVKSTIETRCHEIDDE
jgi:hypothetical protein